MFARQDFTYDVFTMLEPCSF